MNGPRTVCVLAAVLVGLGCSQAGVARAGPADDQLGQCIGRIAVSLVEYILPAPVQEFVRRVSDEFGADLYEWRAVKKSVRRLARDWYPVRDCERLIMETDELIQGLLVDTDCRRAIKADPVRSLDLVANRGALGATFRAKIACYVFG